MQLQQLALVLCNGSEACGGEVAISMSTFDYVGQHEVFSKVELAKLTHSEPNRLIFEQLPQKVGMLGEELWTAAFFQLFLPE